MGGTWQEQIRDKMLGNVLKKAFSIYSDVLQHGQTLYTRSGQSD